MYGNIQAKMEKSTKETKSEAGSTQIPRKELYARLGQVLTREPRT